MAASTGGTAVPRERAGWRSHAVLLLLAAFYADTFMGRQIMAVMVVPLKEEFGIGDTAIGLVSGLAFALVYGLLGLPLSSIADRRSRTRMLAACGVLWALATVLCGLATGIGVLLAARMLVAAAEAPVTAASLSVVADLYPPEGRGLAISLFTSAPTFAAIAALSAGAWMVDSFGWRTSFLLLALPALPIAAALVLFDCEPRRGRWDDLPPRAPVSAGMLATALALWRRPAYRLLAVAAALTTMCGYSFAMWNASFLVRSHGLSLQEAGLYAGLAGGGGAGIGAVFSGWLIDRLAARSRHWYLGLPVLGHLLATVMLVAYLLWPPGPVTLPGGAAVPAAVLVCAVHSFFSVWWVAPCFTLMTRIVDPGQRAVAMAVQTTLATLLGVGVGPLAVGLLSDLLAPALGTDSLRWAMIAAGLLPLMPVVLFWRVHVQLGREVPAPAA